MTFVFPDEDTLRLAIAGGAVPSSVSLAPVRAGRNAAGALWLAPGITIPDGVPEALLRIGVTIADALPTGGDDLAHWLQLLSLIRDSRPPHLTDQTPVLFELSAATFAEFAGEMLRLGNDRQGFRVLRRKAPGGSSLRAPPTVLLRVLGPPYFSLLQAIDRSRPTAPRAFHEHSPGVWMEHGWTHPLAGQLRAPEGQLILLRAPKSWEHLDSSQFRDVYEALDFVAQPDVIVESAASFEEPLAVTLRLVAGNTTDPPELWVLPPDGEVALDDLVREASPRSLGRLAFAVGEAGGQRITVVRSRPGKGRPPVLAFDGASPFRPFQRLPNLFLPCGARLQPPLRREAVRGLLADDPDLVTWLVPLGDGAFVRQSLPEAAFRPLGDWVEHVLDRDRAALESWAAATRFDFGSIVSKSAMVAEPVARTPAAPSRDRSATPDDPPPAPPIARPVRRRGRAVAAPVDPLPEATATPGELQRALRAAEERFLDLEGSLDTPNRQAMWPELGRLNGALGHAAESSLCWMHALWESPNPVDGTAWGWVQAERALMQRELSADDLARLTANSNPTVADVRPLAAAVVWAAIQRPVPAALQAAIPALQQYLGRHDRLLPVRGVWLVWHALSQNAGADALALARVRDRLLDRLLTDGLSPERDLPGFLRFSGQQGGDRLRVVRERMERLRQRAHAWSGFPRNDSLQQTPAYIDLLFAFANARLGEAGAAAALVAHAAESIDASGSDAHRFLLQAFQFRIDQVLAGRLHAGPLPLEQIEYLEQMRKEAASPDFGDAVARMGPYVVERMRRESRIVDPHEELDPYRHTKLEHDELIRDLARIADVHDKRVLSDSLRRLTAAAKSKSLEEVRLRVLAESLPLAARVGEGLAGELLDQVIPALDARTESFDPNVIEKRTLLLERAVFFAAHFDRSDLVPMLVERLEGVLAVHAPTEIVLEARSRLVGQTLRSLRRLGQRDASDRLLEQLSRAILGGQSLDDGPRHDPRKWAETLRALLHLAGGWLSADQTDRAREILDAARTLILTRGQLVPAGKAPLYVSLVCNYVSALARAPLDDALGRVEELFAPGKMDSLPNTFTTNPYYSRFHLNIVEAVVLALANEEFAIGPAARRWLDDDEYLIRRRIHRDVRTAVEQQ